MGRYRKKKMHVNDKSLKKKYRTKRRTKDLDQIQEDLRDENARKLTNQPLDNDLPGSGQYYCLTCARYFIDNTTLTKHFRSKLHKRRLHALKEPVYTQRESEMAAGIGNYILPAAPLEYDMKTIEYENREHKPSEELMNSGIEINMLDRQLQTLQV